MADCCPDGRAKKGDQIGKSPGKGVGGERGGSSFARVGGGKKIRTN